MNGLAGAWGWGMIRNKPKSICRPQLINPTDSFRPEAPARNPNQPRLGSASTVTGGAAKKRTRAQRLVLLRTTLTGAEEPYPEPGARAGIYTLQMQLIALACHLTETCGVFFSAKTLDCRSTTAWGWVKCRKLQNAPYWLILLNLSKDSVRERSFLPR